MFASIIIPSYKSERSIRLCLNSLLKQRVEAAYEIIVVNSLPSPYIDEIEKNLPTVKFIKLNSRVYPGVARNIGARRALGELLIFIDSDIIVPDGWLGKVIAYYEGEHNVFGGAIDILNDKNSMMDMIEWFFEFSEYKSYMKEGTRWCLPSCALAIKRSIFDSEQFLNMATSEDVEFSVRLNNKGNFLYFNPALKVFHVFNSSFSKLLKKAFNFGSSNMRIRKMHQVSGSKIARFVPAAFFIIPIFAVIKFTKISWRNIQYNTIRHKAMYIITIPFTLLVILFWMIGCYYELLPYFRKFRG